jgi:hypothetical protein
MLLVPLLLGVYLGVTLLPYFRYVFKDDEELVKFAEKLIEHRSKYGKV